MKFNSDSAAMKWNHGASKEALEQGYETVPMDANLVGKVANQRLGLTNPWVSVCEPEDNSVEWSD